MLITMLTYLQWYDWLDVFLVSFVTYRILIMIKGTRAVQMLLGLAVVAGIYIISQESELVMTRWALNNVMNSLILLIVVLFQSDIRRALTSVGKTPFFGDRDKEKREIIYSLEEIIKACTTLSEKKIGALVVIEKETGLKDYVEGGVELDAKVTKELITSIFFPKAPIHDGAIIIQRNKIKAAGCFLPLTMDPGLSKSLGTRHRAAIEISLETDAVVLVVSEETGKISLVSAGKIIKIHDNDKLWELLQKHFISIRKSKG
ncbi:diadenylate cyclase CdaA [Thermodesulfobacteriota bacterium]